VNLTVAVKADFAGMQLAAVKGFFVETTTSGGWIPVGRW